MMMGPKRLLAAAVVVGAFSAAPLTAEPLDLRRVSSEAKWILHVDIDRVRATDVGRALLAALEEETNEIAADMQAQFGFDPLVDVHAVTVYGVGAVGDDAVIVATVTDAVEGALERLRREQPVEQRTREGVAYEAVGEDGGEAFLTTLRDDAGRRVLVITATEDNLVPGALVVQGRRDRLAALDFASPSEQSFVFFTAIDALKMNDKVQMGSQFLRLTSRVGMDIGGNKDVFARLVLEAQDEASAQSMWQGIQGLMAFARLAAANQQGMDEQDRKALDLLNNVRSNVAGRAVTLEFFATLEAIKELIEE